MLDHCICGVRIAVHGCGCLREMDMTDMVNSPPHYGGADNPYEHIKVAEALGWGYHIGNCTKYLWRLGRKDPTKVLEDAEKALWYLQRFITNLKKEETSGR